MIAQSSNPRVLAIIGDRSGPTLWRVFQPYAEINRRGGFAHWKDVEDPELQDPVFQIQVAAKFHAIILARMSWHYRYAAALQIRAMHRAGVPVLLEIDDDMFSPGIVDRQLAVFERERDKGRERVEREREDRIWLLNQVDGITVSTRRLATIVGQYTDTPIEVIPNAIDLRWFRRVLKGGRRLVPPLTVGWAGGARNPADLEPVAAAWSRIAERFPRVRFVVQGHMAELLIDAVPEDRLRRLPWAPIEEYPRALLNIDIGCASVAPTLFSTAKTPIKVWEYAAAGAAVVCSPTLYGPYVQHGVDALVAESAAQWEWAIARLIEDDELRGRLRGEQRKRVASMFALERNWWRWPTAWSRLLERIAERQQSRARTVTA